MSLSKKIQNSIIENLSVKDEVDEYLIEFLVKNAIRNSDKIDNEVIPSFLYNLDREV